MLGVNSRATSDDFVFKKVSDNGANMKRLGQLFERLHVLGTVRLPHAGALHAPNHVHAQTGHGNEPPAAPLDESVQHSFAKARGIVSYLHHSLVVESCFHDCQRHVGLPETKIHQDVRTRCGARATRWLSKSCTTRTSFSK